MRTAIWQETAIQVMVGGIDGRYRQPLPNSVNLQAWKYFMFPDVAFSDGKTMIDIAQLIFGTAETLAQQGLHGSAWGYYEQALCLNPDDTAITESYCNSLFMSAQSDKIDGKLKPAELSLLKLLSVEPNKKLAKELLGAVLVSKGLALAGKGQSALAETCFREAQDWDETLVIPQLQQLVEPDNQNLLDDLCKGRVSAETAVDMENLVRRVFSRRPEMRTVLTPVLAQSLYLQGNELFDSDDMIGASIALRKSLHYVPNAKDTINTLSFVLYNISTQHFNAKRILEAEAYALDAIRLKPDFEEASTFLKLCSRHQDRVICNLNSPNYSYITSKIKGLLEVKDIDGVDYIRLGAMNDGGYVMANVGLANTVAYSLGISGDVSWDADMAAMGTHLFQYDHTIDSLPYEDAHFHWFKVGISTTSVSAPPFKTLNDLIEENGHSQRHDLILKTDIEGAEWDALIYLDDSLLSRFSQIVGEFHGFMRLNDPIRRTKIITVLEKINQTHQLVHIHANNYSRQGFIAGHAMADDLELTDISHMDGPSAQI